MILETASGRYVGSLFVAEEADACLMAASPDLLAACEAFRKAMQGRGDIPLPEDFCRDLVNAHCLAIEAIRKAATPTPGED